MSGETAGAKAFSGNAGKNPPPPFAVCKSVKTLGRVFKIEWACVKREAIGRTAIRLSLREPRPQDRKTS
jgi:hypothetical protein